MMRYYPEFRRLDGVDSIGALFLSHILDYWRMKGREAFYKFNAPCGHKLYKAGDSWQETLDLSRRQFDKIKRLFATRVNRDDKRHELERVRDEAGNLAPIQRILLYWNDHNNVTWWWLNEDLLVQYVQSIGLSATDIRCGVSQSVQSLITPESSPFNHDVDDSFSSDSESGEFSAKGEGRDTSALTQDVPEVLSPTAQALFDIGVSPGMAKRFEAQVQRVTGWLDYVSRRATIGDPVHNPAAYIVKMLQNGEDAPEVAPVSKVERREHPPEEKAPVVAPTNDAVDYEPPTLACDVCGKSTSRFFSSERCTCTRDLSNQRAEVALSKPEQIWNAAYNQLELQLDTHSFKCWVEGSRFERQDGDLYVIVAKNTYAEQQLNGRFKRLVERVLSDVAGVRATAQFRVVRPDVARIF